MKESTKSTLRTVVAFLSLLVQCVALHFIVHYHPR